MGGRDVRWMIRRDLRRVLEIDGASFAEPWTEDAFLALLRQRNSIAMVIERDGEIVGFMVHMLFRDRLVLLRLAVDIVHRRQGIGRRLVQQLIDKLASTRRRCLRVTVPETWFDTLRFFRAVGLVAVELLRGHYGEEDGIRFEWMRPGAEEAREFDAEEDGECEAVG